MFIETALVYQRSEYQEQITFLKELLRAHMQMFRIAINEEYLYTYMHSCQIPNSISYNPPRVSTVSGGFALSGISDFWYIHCIPELFNYVDDNA